MMMSAMSWTGVMAMPFCVHPALLTFSTHGVPDLNLFRSQDFFNVFPVLLCHLPHAGSVFFFHFFHLRPVLFDSFFSSCSLFSKQLFKLCFLLRSEVESFRKEFHPVIYTFSSICDIVSGLYRVSLVRNLCECAAKPYG